LTVAPTDATIATPLNNIADTNLGIYMQNDLIPEDFAYEALIQNGTIVRRLNFSEYPFIPIIGISCNGCRKPIHYCDKAIKTTYAR